MNRAPKKILIAHKYCGFIGGIEKYIYETAKLLTANGYILYGIFEEEFGSNQDEFKSVFSKICFFDQKNVSNSIKGFLSEDIKDVFIHKLSNPEIFKELQKSFRTTLFVHDHDYYCMRGHKYYSFNRKNCYRAFNILFCTLCDRPVYRDAEGKPKLKSTHPFKHKSLLKAAKNCDRFVVLSEHMKKNLILNKFNNEKIIKIYPYISIPEFDSSGGVEKNSLLFVGQIIRGKGLDLLLRAMTYLTKNITLDIVGRGNDENYIKELITELKLENKVNLIGFTLNIDKWYENAYAVIVPSRWQEPFGLIGSEAYSHRKPVVAFDVGGISEWLKNDKNGFLVEPDNPEALALAIEKLLDNEELAQEMGDFGYEFIKNNFNSDVYLSKISELTGD